MARGNRPGLGTRAHTFPLHCFTMGPALLCFRRPGRHGVLELRALDVMGPLLAELLHFRVWVVDDADVLIRTLAGDDLRRQGL